MNTRPPIATATATGSETTRRPADFLQPLARRADQRPMTGQPGPATEKEPRRLVVAQGIALSGSIEGCQRLIIEGKVEATLESCDTLEIAERGVFEGLAEVMQAEVRGLVDGELTVRGRLVIRATGRVTGRIRYQDLHIEAGGKLAGQIEALEEEPEAPPTEAEPAAERREEPPRFSIAASSPAPETRPEQQAALSPSWPATPAAMPPVSPPAQSAPLDLPELSDQASLLPNLRHS